MHYPLMQAHSLSEGGKIDCQHRRTFFDRLRQLLRNMNARRGASRLYEMDDHALADLGLTRGSIDYAAWNGRE
ncbi:DUF1127 domain-containing protein [Rhizobium aegyptiacum]|uniref:DUF1127 domain-containing protein n=1 Tax=Rhizobium aegyptiacum TaxID=1764550 RepID=UPI0007E599E4|nr:DUF1127 domain-containing protein [Rhizobium aegyptiacum]